MSTRRRLRVVAAAVGGASFALCGVVAWHASAAVAPSGADAALQVLLDRFVAEGRAHHVVLALSSGHGGSAWAGAAGAARIDGPPLRPQTPIRIASITKLYTATVILRLEEQGLLSIDDPMGRYLPAVLVERLVVVDGVDVSARITLRQLLAHRSGIADYYEGRGPDGKTLLDRFLEAPDRRWTVEETIDRARELGATSAPEKRTAYSDTNYQLLGKVIERVTGRPLHEAYETLIFRPLGLTRTWLEGHRPQALASDDEPASVFDHGRDIDRVRANGAYWADGGIVSTAEEMIVFLRALEEGRLLRPSTVARMHAWRPMDFPFDYGLGTMRFSLPWPLDRLLGLPPMRGHSGSTGSFLYRIEDRDLYVAGTLDEAGARQEPFRLLANAIAVWGRYAPPAPAGSSRSDTTQGRDAE